MRLLLDTHYAVWLTTQHGQLRPAELTMLVDPALEAHVSTISIWEIRLKWSSFFRSGERKGPVDPSELLESLEAINVTILPLLPSEAARPLALPLRHKDPFDELLLVHAQEHGLKLLTRDRNLKGHPLAVTAP